MRKQTYILFALLLLQACKTPQTVTTSHGYTDFIRLNTITQNQSVIDHYHTFIQKGDTIYITDSVHTKDSIYIQIIDTIYLKDSTTNTITQLVEKQLSPFQQFFIKSGYVLWAIILITIIIYIVKLYLKSHGI